MKPIKKYQREGTSGIVYELVIGIRILTLVILALFGVAAILVTVQEKEIKYIDNDALEKLMLDRNCKAYIDFYGKEL